jgi:iron-sulfur cluster assembly protein
MLAVTDPAKELLRSIEVPPDRALRLEPENDGRLAFTASSPENDDQVVEEQGQEILRIAQPVSHELDGHSLDRVETPEGPRLTIRGPETADADGAGSAV